MKLKKYQDWKFSTKIMTLFILAIVIFLTMIWFYLLPKMENKLYDEKKNTTKNVIEIAYSLVAEYNQRIDKKEFSFEEGQDRARKRIQSLRYGDNDYFWITNVDTKMIMHPIKTELVGKEMSDYKDANGKLFLLEAVDICKSNGEGYVDYMWPKPGIEKPVPKVTFVKLYKPWGWIIGTGIYIDDVEAEIGKLKSATLMALIVSIFLTLIPAIFFVKNLSKSSLAVNLQEQSKLITSASKKLLHISEQTATTSAELLAKAGNAASSSEEISISLSTVSSSSEEMASSIKEISRHTSTASKITEEARNRANSANEVMNRLGISSTEIGNIVKVINSIAEQTNLLALNATIEAARAGEAGKGFAVVANEVKELAKGSAKATEDISKRIKIIQEDSKNAIIAIKEIIDISSHVSDITNTIAGAIEEQSVTVNEVNRNLSEATRGVTSIAENNQNIASTANEYSKLSTLVKSSSDELQKLVNELEKQLRNNFKL